jgi:hypothetical protein
MVILQTWMQFKNGRSSRRWRRFLGMCVADVVSGWTPNHRTRSHAQRRIILQLIQN